MSKRIKYHKSLFPANNKSHTLKNAAVGGGAPLYGILIRNGSPAFAETSPGTSIFGAAEQKRKVHNDRYHGIKSWHAFYRSTL